MRKTGLRVLAIVASLAAAAGAALAQGAVPTYRYVVTPDTDFYGSDLDSLFDTDLLSCIRACDANRACTAFTFNSRSNACFPKAGISQRTRFQGAISAQKFPTGPAVLQAAPDRAGTLAFLQDEDLARAAELGRLLGLRYQAGGLDLEAVLDAARGRAAAGDEAQALGWTGMAVSLSDRADLWTEFARLSLQLDTGDGDARRARTEQAVSAAINGYLRGETAADRAEALLVLSQGLERVGRGRDTIPALRLARRLQDRPDIAEALDGAIRRHGFRVTESTVESDSAAPRLCARFSEPLVRTGVDYEPFVRRPDPTLPVQVDGDSLCIDGVRHGERYRITLRRGLPAASGETLYKDVELTHYVRDRTPRVSFPGRSYVLPRTGAAALPVETVNLREIDLTLRRVSDRNLLRAVQDGYFGRPLAYWEDEVFGAEIAQPVWTGKGIVDSELNRDMITRLPLAEAIAGQPAGSMP